MRYPLVPPRYLRRQQQQRRHKWKSYSYRLLFTLFLLLLQLRQLSCFRLSSWWYLWPVITAAPNKWINETLTRQMWQIGWCWARTCGGYQFVEGAIDAWPKEVWGWAVIVWYRWTGVKIKIRFFHHWVVCGTWRFGGDCCLRIAGVSVVWVFRATRTVRFISNYLLKWHIIFGGLWLV